MDNVLNALKWIALHKEDIIVGYFAVVGLFSWLVKLTPTLKDDNILKAIVKFVGKYIAVDKYGPKSGEVKPGEAK